MMNLSIQINQMRNVHTMVWFIKMKNNAGLDGHSSTLRRVVISYKRKYVHEVLVNRLVNLAQENVN